MSNRRRLRQPRHMRQRRAHLTGPEAGVVDPITPEGETVAMTYAATALGDPMDLAAARALVSDQLVMELGDRRRSRVSFRQYDPTRREKAIDVATDGDEAAKSKLVAYFGQHPEGWLVIGYANHSGENPDE